jgi:hypothetical protein
MGLKNIIYLGAFSLFVVIVWIFMGLYHSRNTPTISSSTEKKAAPIDPSFDTDIINEIKQRKQIQANLGEGVVLPTIAASQNQSTSSAQTEPVLDDSEDVPEEAEEEEI